MPVYLLADLRTPQTQAVIRARLIAALNGRGLPTDAWVPSASGGVENTIVDMVAGTLATLLGAKMAQEVSDRFLDFATGDGLTFLAKHFYQLDRAEATKTIESVELFSVPAAGENTFEVGDVWVASSATGNRYVNLDRMVVPAGGNAPPSRFEAENAGASYSDPANTITTMIVAPAGVSCMNIPPSDYLPTRQTGFSTGTVQAAGADADHVTPPVILSIRVRIIASGNVGAALFQYTIDAGATWIDGGPVPSTPFLIPGPPDVPDGGAKLFFANGATPSFIVGSIFTLLLGNAILQQGRDTETDPSLRARCRDRWPGLSTVPTEGLVRLWAQVASPEVHKVLVDADPGTPGGIIVTLASSAGPASAAAQIAVEDYVTARLLGFKGVPEPSAGAGSPEETVHVLTAVARPLTPAGTVDVPRDRVPAVQQAADRLWQAYLRDLGIGATVILAELEQALMDAGAFNVSGVMLNGLAANVDLASNEVAVPANGTSLTASLSWRPGVGQGSPVPAPDAATPVALTFPARNEIEATLLSFLADPDFAVTDWNSGGVARTLLELETETIDDLIGRVDSALPAILLEGSADLADGDWLTAVARGLYGLDRALGTIATQTITIACNATSGPYLFTAGASFFTATDGRRYVAATSGTLSPSGTLVLDVSGESPGVALGLVNALAPPLNGVTVAAAAIKIVGGVPQYGSNDETDSALIKRCLARWPDLSAIGTVDRVEIWARAGSAEVTRIRLDADPVNPGGVIVTVAGTGGAVSGSAVSAVQDYVDARAPITDFVTVQNATNLTVTAGGVVTVPVAQMPAIQTAADAAWIAYLASAQIGGTVYLSQLLKVVMDAGAYDIAGLTLNTFAADLLLASTQVPIASATGLATLLNWTGV